MRSWQRIVVGGLLVVAIAAAGIALNLALLGLTQRDDDPVGKLSPGAVFDRSRTTSHTEPPSTTDRDDTTTGDDDSNRDHSRDHDEDDDD